MEERKYFVLLCVFLFITTVLNMWRACQLVKHCRMSEDILQQSSHMDGAHVEATRVTKMPTEASIDSSDPPLEGPLPSAFKAALEQYPVVPKRNVSIVAIIAYYRSGSSFFAELMSSTPRTFLHFEPLMMFTVSGSIRPGRQQHAFQLLNGLVRCRFDPLYTAWLESQGRYKHNHFLTDICGNGESCTSPGPLSALCSRAQTQVLKFTRLRVAQVQSWIESNHVFAQSVRVVHLVRDPRGMYSSRRGLRWCTDYEHCDSPAALCAQMRADLDAFGELASRMPKHATYQIRFEDIAANPMNETKRIFARLGLDFAPSVAKYITEHTTANPAEMKKAHSTWRNTKEVADRWRQRLPMIKIREIEATCNDVMQRLGYKRFE